MKILCNVRVANGSAILNVNALERQSYIVQVPRNCLSTSNIRLHYNLVTYVTTHVLSNQQSLY